MDFLPSLPTLLAFTAASLLLAATPGPDMTLSISRALSQGKAAAMFVVIGTSLGCLVHTFLVAFGVSAQTTAPGTTPAAPDRAAADIAFVRADAKFADATALQEQMGRDVERARQLLGAAPVKPGPANPGDVG